MPSMTNGNGRPHRSPSPLNNPAFSAPYGSGDPNTPMWEKNPDLYNRGVARGLDRGMNKSDRSKWDWKRATDNFQVFEQRRTDKWSGVLYLPSDILRVGRTFGEIEIIRGITEAPHHCNCSNCKL